LSVIVYASDNYAHSRNRGRWTVDPYSLVAYVGLLASIDMFYE